MKKLLFLFLFTCISYISSAQCKGNCENGKGLYEYKSGEKYNGEWLNGKHSGQGTLTTKDYKYEGEWSNGKPHGQGTETWANGNKYVGEWMDGKPNGNGTQTWANGDKYVGEWKDYKFHGKGTFTFIEGQIETGNWKENNLFDGFSTFFSDKEGQAGLEIKYVYNDGNVVDTLYNSKNYFNIKDVIGENISDTIFLINRKTKYDIVLTINTVPVKWRFDTGAETTSINKDQWDKIKSKINYEDLNITRKTEGVGGFSTGSLVKIKDEIQIGDYLVKNFIVSIANNKHSLLGIDFLQKFSNVEWNMKEALLIVYK